MDPNNKIMNPDHGPVWDVSTGIPDLTGKVAVVTGANSSGSIGYHIAHQLAIKGARVYVSARSQATPFKKNAYGISDSFATNHISPFVFTTELLPLLKKTSQVYPGVRVVNVASTSHGLVPADIKLGSVDDFNQLLGGTDDLMSNLTRYVLSKLANILFSKELQNVFDAQGIKGVVLSTHPGVVRSDGAMKLADEVPMLRDTVLAGLSPLEGALAELFAATNPIVWTEREKYAGAYLVPFGIFGQTSEAAQNGALARQLWAASEEVTKKLLAEP